MNQLRFALLASTLVALTACGGGGADDAGAPSANQAGSSNCPTAAPADVWMDQRLGCLTVGARFHDISASSGAAGTQDYSFALSQRAIDNNFNNILGPQGGKRYWANFVCVRNAPAGGFGTGSLIGLGTDMAVAMGISNFGTRKPAGISASYISVESGGQAGVMAVRAEACNAAIHPVIVDYATGLVVSLNPGALGAMTTYTLY